MKIILNVFLLGLLLLQVVLPSAAIYENQAGLFDWHHTWVGHPREAVKLDEKHIAVYSERNIIASLNTDNGAVVWRQVLENQLDHFVVTETGILTITSKPERAQFWNNSNGQLIWEHTLPQDESYDNTMPITWKNGDIAVFVDRTKLIRLSKDGDVLWTWIREANEGQVFERLKLIERGDLIYVIVEPNSDNKSPFFFVNIIYATTGETSSTFKIPCSSNYDDVTYTGDYLIWTEADILKWTLITKKQIASTSIKSLVKSLPTADKFIPSKISLFGGDYAEAASFILSTEFENDDDVLFSASVLVDIQEKAMSLNHYYGEHASYGGADFFKKSVIRAVRSDSQELTVQIVPEGKELKIKHDFSLSGEVNYIKLIDMEPFRLIVITDGSSVFLYNESSIIWSREEALSAIAASEFLDLPEQKMWTQMADELDETAAEQAAESPVSRYIRRLRTHILELRRLPGWIVSHFIAMSSSNLKVDNNKVSILEAQSCWLNDTEPEVLYRDNFGLRKLLISVTKSGKIIAQDTARNGKIVWSRYIDSFSFTQIHLVRAAAVKLPPLIVAIGNTFDEVGGQAVGFVRLNALTGDDYITNIPEIADFFEPMVSTNIGVDKVMRLPVEDPDERTHLLAVYEAGSGRVYIYPDTLDSQSKFVTELLPTFYFAMQNADGNMQGFKVVEGYRGSLKAEPVWKFIMPPDEKTAALSHSQPHEKVASLGRALGNRNVLYKYLNPHMFALITKNMEKKLIKVRIMDSVKGSILYETIHENVDTEYNDVHVIQSENWIIYHFWSNDSKARGYQTAVLELFEGQYENERVESANFSSFDNIEPHVLSSAFAFPYPITAMGVTITRNGISTKDILFGLSTHQIMGVNKRLFDPRRPIEKPTKEDQEEQLFPYGPIPDERRLFLTYGLDVAGVKSIITSPSLLESTALVFAYGLDSFFTRSSPSKQFDVLSEDFSKIQLLLTITGLIVGIWITGPIVRRKRVNALWK
ncbi:hypothetical protein [Parasitella parasitica]|uniref:ER membrane protein complex subunit 1 n=1 Tax=Parasitella parasitica TaxID=35722 RepID=A0A0B7MYU9_9FUNG|nr:hypothetical protein [Parasitella parasitica]